MLQPEQRDLLLHDADHRRVISICHKLMSNVGREAGFYWEMKKALKPKNALCPGIYELVYKLGAIFVTTNADELFDPKFEKLGPDRVVVELSSRQVQPTDHHLYHLHGSVKNTNTLVFTAKQYLVTYAEETVKQFIESLFRDHTVLVIGYGLSEMELLEYAVRKGFDAGQEPKHFVLKDYWRSEFARFELDAHYYSLMGFKVIPYAKDELEFAQMEKILDSWVKQIGPVNLHRDVQTLENTAEVKSPSENQVRQVLDLLKEPCAGDLHARVFFKALQGAQNPTQWLFHLMASGFLRSAVAWSVESPPERPDTLPIWPPLTYLERMVTEPPASM